MKKIVDDFCAQIKLKEHYSLHDTLSQRFCIYLSPIFYFFNLISTLFMIELNFDLKTNWTDSNLSKITWWQLFVGYIAIENEIDWTESPGNRWGDFFFWNPGEGEITPTPIIMPLDARSRIHTSCSTSILNMNYLFISSIRENIQWRNWA